MRANKVLAYLLTVTILIATLSTPAIAAENIKIVSNGTELTFDIPPQLIDGRVMLPMVNVFEALGGARIEWDEKNQAIRAYPSNGGLIGMQIGNKVIAIDPGMDGQQFITFDVAPVVVDGHVLIPVRAIAEIMGAKVEWIHKSQTVTITNEFVFSIYR